MRNACLCFSSGSFTCRLHKTGKADRSQPGRRKAEGSSGLPSLAPWGCLPAVTFSACKASGFGAQGRLKLEYLHSYSIYLGINSRFNFSAKVECFIFLSPTSSCLRDRFRVRRVKANGSYTTLRVSTCLLNVGTSIYCLPHSSPGLIISSSFTTPPSCYHHNNLAPANCIGTKTTPKCVPSPQLHLVQFHEPTSSFEKELNMNKPSGFSLVRAH